MIKLYIFCIANRMENNLLDTQVEMNESITNEMVYNLNL